MELLDFAKLIGGHINFSGSFDPKNTYINAMLKVDSDNVTLDGVSIYGRTEGIELDLALINLALVLRGKRIRSQIGLNYKYYDVPADLVHSWGYRNKK